MSTELEKLERKVTQLRTTNAGIANEIEQLGGGVEVSIARIEHFISWICERLAIDDVDKLNEQLDWEMGLKPQLLAIRDRLREQKERLEAELRRRQAAIEARQSQASGGSGKKAEIWTPGKK